MRPIEADVFSSMDAAWSSANGDYRGWDAERVPMWDENRVKP